MLRMSLYKGVPKPAIYTPWQKTIFFSSVSVHIMLQASLAAIDSQSESLVIIYTLAEFPKGLIFSSTMERLQLKPQLRKTLQQISSYK